MSRFLVLVPSRGRPDAAHELVAAFAETTTYTGTELRFVVDADDPTRAGYPDNTIGTASSTMVQALNLAAGAAVNGPNPPRFIGFMGDDHRPRTRGWDRAYARTLALMGTGLVYADDGFMGPRIPTQVAMTADIVAALGYMAPPALTHLYVDNYWKTLGLALGAIRYLPNVLIEHVHPAAGKAEWTEGHVRVNDQSMYDRDRWVFERLDIATDAALVRKATS